MRAQVVGYAIGLLLSVNFSSLCAWAQGESNLAQPAHEELISPQKAEEWLSVIKTPGMRYYKPLEFLGTQVFPELKQFRDKPEVRGLLNQSESYGYTIAVGHNANRDTYFDLQHTGVTFPNYGLSSLYSPFNNLSRVGSLNYITHDISHISLGRIGVDLSKPLSKQVEDMNRAYGHQEAFASLFSAWFHLPDYWNLKAEESGMSPAEVAEFKKYNNGTFSIGSASTKDYVDFLMHHWLGNKKQYHALLQANIDPVYFRKALAAQVPQLVPAFIDRLPEKMRWFVLKKIIPPLMVNYTYYFYFGYKGITNFAKANLEFESKPWMLKWRQDFAQFSMKTPQQVQDRANEFFQKAKTTGKRELYAAFTKPTSPKAYWARFFNNQTALLGRRIAEMMEVVTIHRPADGVVIAELKQFYRQCAELNKVAFELAQLEQPSVKSIDEVARKMKTLIANLNEKNYFSYIPEKGMPEFADVRNYWADPTAALLPRPNLLKSFMPADTIYGYYKKKNWPKEWSTKTPVLSGSFDDMGQYIAFSAHEALGDGASPRKIAEFIADFSELSLRGQLKPIQWAYQKATIKDPTAKLKGPANKCVRSLIGASKIENIK